MTKINNSVMLYLYDAKLTNPNGDPDEENRPRMDAERDINLVSDLRLKRYVRDYLADRGYALYVQKIDGESVTPEQRLKLDFEKATPDVILDALIDIRLFGATIPIPGANKSYTGPVQFNWGYSLNKVELIEAGITSHFLTKDTKKQGAMGRDYRVKYSLIAFSGVISGKRAPMVNMKSEDITLLDEAMVKAIPLQATRSKVGQYPRLYLRVELKDDMTILDELRHYVKIESDEENIRDIGEYCLDITALQSYLLEHQARIEKIYYYHHEELKLICAGESTKLAEALSGFALAKLS